MPFPLGTGTFPSLDGLIKLLKTLTVSSDELNILDGATLDTTELNKLDGVAGDVVGTSDSQTLTNKNINADNNSISNLEHGSEVDNPSSGVHGVSGNIVGTSGSQTLTNKNIDADNNNISNLEHGNEVDEPSSGTHGVVGNIVGTSDSQVLTNKTISGSNNTITDITKVESIADQGTVATGGILTKVLEIGIWNMDSTAGVSIAHGISSMTDILSVSALIHSDSDAGPEVVSPLEIAPGGSIGGWISISTSNIALSRVPAGYYDQADYNGTSFTRGKIIIQYKV